MNNYYNNQKIKYLNLQLIANFGFIVAVFISFILTYDKKLSLENKERIFSNFTAQKLVVFQTTLVFLVSVSYLLINYDQYKLSKQYNKDDLNDFALQIETSILAIIAALIGVYIVSKNYNNTLTISETEI